MMRKTTMPPRFPIYSKSSSAIIPLLVNHLIRNRTKTQEMIKKQTTMS